MNLETGVTTLWGYFNQVVIVSAVYMADFARSLNCCVMLSGVHLIIRMHFMNSDSEAYCIANIFHGAIFFVGPQFIFRVTG